MSESKTAACPPDGCFEYPSCECGEADAGTPNSTDNPGSVTAPWRPIETAPEDGTVVWVYTAAAHDLPAFQGPCAYHPDAGWCTDELRAVTHWVPLQTVYLEPPL